MKFVNTVEIARPTSEVFAFVADLENVPKWNYAIVETRKTSPGPVAVGTTYRQVRSIPRPSEEMLEIVAFEPRRLLALRGDLGPFHGTLTYEFDEIDGKTRLTNTAELEASGLVGVARSLVAPRVKAAVAENLQTLKSILERAG